MINFELIVLVVIAFSVAGFVKGAIGLGFSTIALPILVLGIGIKASLPLVLVPSLLSNVVVMRKAGGFVSALKEYQVLFAMTVLGVVGGVMILGAIETGSAAQVLGVFLVIYAAHSLWRSNKMASWGRSLLVQSSVGISTGVVNGITGSQMMPLLPYLISLDLPPQRLVQVSNISFTLSSLVMFVGLSQIGIMTMEALVASIVGTPAMYVGIVIGNRLQSRLSADSFRTGVILLLGSAGVILIFKPLFAA